MPYLHDFYAILLTNREKFTIQGLSVFKPVKSQIICHKAGVVKLVDAEDSKSSGRKSMRVRFPPPAPNKNQRSLPFWVTPFFYGEMTVGENVAAIL